LGEKDRIIRNEADTHGNEKETAPSMRDMPHSRSFPNDGSAVSVFELLKIGVSSPSNAVEMMVDCENRFRTSSESDGTNSKFVAVLRTHTS
jgi:hypothetical protein